MQGLTTAAWRMPPASPSSEDALATRTLRENFAQTWRVFRPAIADFAAAYGVSCEVVFQWLKGEVVPDAGQLERICALGRAAEAFERAHVAGTRSTLKMKMFEGCSLLDLVAAGESRPEHVRALVAEVRAMALAERHSGLAGSGAAAVED